MRNTNTANSRLTSSHIESEIIRIPALPKNNAMIIPTSKTNTEGTESLVGGRLTSNSIRL